MSGEQVAMDTDEVDDPIIEEIPVFLSKALANDLYLFQFPTKAESKSIDQLSVLNCCIKPIHNEVKVDFVLNTEAVTYDRHKGERVAQCADGNKPSKNERLSFKRGIMDKHTFKSSAAVDDVNRYMVGVLAEHEVHLTPLKAVLNMQPSFSYYDKEDTRVKAEQRAMDEEEDEEDYHQVTVKFARNTNLGNPTKKLKERNGFDSHLKKIEEEPWCETFWHPSGSTAAELERQRLFSTCQQLSPSFMQPANHYVNTILPDDSMYTRSIEALVPSPVVSKMRLKSMPLGDQLKIILRDAKMLTFSEIVRILKTHVNAHINEERVLQKLPQIGILIKGNWVVQSDVIYPPETFSKINGVRSELMVLARDYIIYRLSRHHTLHRRQVAFATQLPNEEAFEVLTSVARCNSEKKWEPLLPPCAEFEKRHPELVQRQEMVWRATEQTYLEIGADRSTKHSRMRSFRESKSSTCSTGAPGASSGAAAVGAEG